MGTKLRPRELDRAVHALAERQHWVVSWTQLLGLGLSPKAIHTRVAAGRLHRVHRGVYAVGRRQLTIRGHWMAAVLAIGEGAVLSHRSAAALWDLLRGEGRAHVSVARRVNKRQGINLHRCSSLPAEHTAQKDGIPCTSVARTLCDIAATQDERTLERALNRAEILRILDLHAIETVLLSRPRRPGTVAMRRALGALDPSVGEPASDLEELFDLLCDDLGIERPQLNHPFTLPDGSEIYIDAYFPSRRLAVEIDSDRYHRTRLGFIEDRRRDAQLTLAGIRPARFSDADLTAEARPATRRILLELLALEA